MMDLACLARLREDTNMANAPGTESYISLAEATRRYPSYRQGRPTHVGTVIRHIVDGVRLPDGSRLHLEGWRLGGRWVTTAEAVERFVEGLTARHQACRWPAPPPTPASRTRRERERVERELDELGIKRATPSSD